NLNFPVLPLALLAGLVGLAVYLWPQLRQEYLPRFQERDFLMHWIAKPSTGIDALRDDICAVSREMRARWRLQFKHDRLKEHCLDARSVGEAVCRQTEAPPPGPLSPGVGRYDLAVPDRKKDVDVKTLRVPLRSGGDVALTDVADVTPLNPPVRAFGSHIARAAERGEEVVGPNFAELWVSLDPDYPGDYDAARKRIEDVMADHPGFQHDLLT